MIDAFVNESILGKAQKKGLIKVETVNLSKWGIGKWRKVDDTPYGGGAGMVLRVDVVAEAIKDIKKKNKQAKTILLSPQGQKYSQEIAQKFAHLEKDLILICGHYEGFDERIREYVDMEISIGDYVLTGGEIPAAAIIDSVSRLIPNVLGDQKSQLEDSYSLAGEKILEYPHYTKPKEYEGKKVPDVLISGHHGEISKWREQEAHKRTQEKRPDLL